MALAIEDKVFADQGAPVKLAVNMPVSVIRAPDFITLVRNSLPKDPVFPGLIIEVTEDEVISDPENAATLGKLVLP